MKILAKVQYLGTNYHGWQKQDYDSSIQEEIEKVLSKILDTNIVIYGSGRTDAGVHALGQTFHFELKKDFDLERLIYAANALLPSDIKLLSFAVVSDDFHARYSAKGKHYQYRISLVDKNPFLTNLVTFFPYSFDKELFKNALKKFEGEHNFQDFTSKEQDEYKFVRIITKINVIYDDNIVKVDFYGNGFMRYMIRDIIGTALEIARGKESLDYIDKHLDSKERKIVSYKAKSDGLYLIDVIY